MNLANNDTIGISKIEKVLVFLTGFALSAGSIFVMATSASASPEILLSNCEYALSKILPEVPPKNLVIDVASIGKNITICAVQPPLENISQDSIYRFLGRDGIFQDADVRVQNPSETIITIRK